MPELDPLFYNTGLTRSQALAELGRITGLHESPMLRRLSVPQRHELLKAELTEAKGAGFVEEITQGAASPFERLLCLHVGHGLLRAERLAAAGQTATPPPPAAETFQSLASKYLAGGMSQTEAISRAREERPELYAAYRRTGGPIFHTPKP